MGDVLLFALSGTEDGADREITCEELADTAMLEDGLVSGVCGRHREVEAVMGRVGDLLVDGGGVWRGFGRGCPIDGGV